MDLTNKFYKKTLSEIEKGASLNDLYRTLYKYEKLEDYDACAGIYKAIKKKIKECEEFAESSPFPDLSLMYDSVYEQKDYPFINHKID